MLLVDDDAGLRALVRATLETFEVDVDEADGAAAARRRIEAARPDVVVLDVAMPGEDGLSFCRSLRAQPATRAIGVVVLSGDEGVARQAEAVAAGADAFVQKPFSPLELLAVVERVAGGLRPVPFRATERQRNDEQLMLYARDLRHLLELERGQRALLEQAYYETVSALAAALETKDLRTRAHSQRVQRYAVELSDALGRPFEGDRSAEYGFLLHDVGKIGIPDRVLLKPGPLTRSERRLMQTHTLLGEQMLAGVAFLRGEGLRIVRSHHERWDGRGYPDGLGGDEIPLGARIFAVADTLDAMTSHRPYRRALRWDRARAEILEQAGRQFDPAVVEAFVAREDALREIRRGARAA